MPAESRLAERGAAFCGGLKGYGEIALSLKLNWRRDWGAEIEQEGLVRVGVTGEGTGGSVETSTVSFGNWSRGEAR